jgi:hypothetical protein
MILVPAKVLAFVSQGRWIGECPNNCGFADALKKDQPKMFCKECYVIHDVEWPSNAQDIWEALLKRPNPDNRNWFPVGCPVAEKAKNIPMGQTVKELLDEQQRHERGEQESPEWPGPHL